MARKFLVLLLSLALPFVTGCYAPKAIRKIQVSELDTSYLKQGNWVRINYRDSSEKSKWLMGTVFQILENEIILYQEKSEFKIPKNRIIRVDILEKKLNPGGTIILLTGLGFLGLAIAAIIIGPQFPTD